MAASILQGQKDPGKGTPDSSKNFFASSNSNDIATKQRSALDRFLISEAPPGESDALLQAVPCQDQAVPLQAFSGVTMSTLNPNLPKP